MRIRLPQNKLDIYSEGKNPAIFRSSVLLLRADSCSLHNCKHTSRRFSDVHGNGQTRIRIVGVFFIYLAFIYFTHTWMMRTPQPTPRQCAAIRAAAGSLAHCHKKANKFFSMSFHFISVLYVYFLQKIAYAIFLIADPICGGAQHDYAHDYNNGCHKCILLSSHNSHMWQGSQHGFESNV